MSRTITTSTHWSDGQAPPPPMTWKELEQALFQLTSSEGGRAVIEVRLQELARQTPYRPPVGVWRDIFKLAVESAGDPFSSAGTAGEAAMT